MIKAHANLICTALPLVITMFIASAAATAPKEKWLNMAGIEVKVPKNVKAKERPGVDWRQFHFTIEKDRQILFAYVGDHPRFPGQAPDTAPKGQATLNGFSTQSVQWQNPPGALNRELLIDRGTKVYPDRFVHLMYSGLDSREAALSDSIMASLRTTQKGLKP